jgi:hypothetical protein
MLNVENVATPLTAGAVRVPPRIPLDGFVPIAIVIELVAELTGLPAASSTVTLTAGVIELPAVTLLGCTVNASFAGTPSAMLLNVLLIIVVNPVALAVNV